MNNKIYIDSIIFDSNLSFKALAIYITKRYVQKVDYINIFELRKEFKDGIRSVKSGMKELEKKELVKSKDDENYSFNLSKLQNIDTYLYASEPFYDKELKMGDLGMYIHLQHLGILNGEFVEENKLIRCDNYSIDNLYEIINNEGKFSIRGKIKKIIEHKYLSKYPVYIDGKIIKWNMLLNLEAGDFTLLRALKRNYPDPYFIKEINEQSKNFINDPYLKRDEIYYLELFNNKTEEKYYHILLNNEIKDFSFIYE